MLTSYGTRPEHFDTAYPFTSKSTYRAGFRMGGWTKTLIDGVALFTGIALVVPSLLVLLSPLIASAMN